MIAAAPASMALPPAALRTLRRVIMVTPSAFVSNRTCGDGFGRVRSLSRVEAHSMYPAIFDAQCGDHQHEDEDGFGRDQDQRLPSDLRQLFEGCLHTQG